MRYTGAFENIVAKVGSGTLMQTSCKPRVGSIRGVELPLGIFGIVNSPN